MPEGPPKGFDGPPDGSLEKKPAPPEDAAAREAARQEREGDALLANYLERHPESEAPVVEKIGPEVKAFDDLIAAFEREYSIEHLMSLTEAKEAIADPERRAAKELLGPILAQLKLIEGQDGATAQQKEDALAAYRRVSRAVGIINSGRVDHTR